MSTPTRFLFWVCAFMTKFICGLITASMAETKFITSTWPAPEREAKQKEYCLHRTEYIHKQIWTTKKISYPFILLEYCLYYAYFWQSARLRQSFPSARMFKLERWCMDFDKFDTSVMPLDITPNLYFCDLLLSVKNGGDDGAWRSTLSAYCYVPHSAPLACQPMQNIFIFDSRLMKRLCFKTPCLREAMLPLGDAVYSGVLKHSFPPTSHIS